MANEFQIDSLLPADMAAKAEQIGVKKVHLNSVSMFALAILAGAFIALGAIFATTVSAGSMPTSAADGTAAFSTGLPYGVTRLLAGLAFGLGLILVIVGGAELFTGNNLIVMAWANRKVSTKLLLKNWVIVYCGNFVGAIATAVLMYFTAQYKFGNGAIGLFVKAGAPESFWTSIHKTAAEFANLTWDKFLINNLLPVTIGNIIGGALMVGVVYWFIYLRHQHPAVAAKIALKNEATAEPVSHK